MPYLDRIPVFAGEWVLRSLLEPFLALGKALVPTMAVSMDGAIEQ